MRDQKKIGVSISYINLVLSTLINIFLTPMIISALGDTNYSIYKVMQSFAGPLIMFNLGVSTIVTRAIVKYESSEEKNLKQKQNTVGLALFTSVIMSIFVAIIGMVMCMLIPNIYGGNYNSAQIQIGQRTFIVFVIATICHILTDVFNGCAVGHERFAFNSSMGLLKNILRASLILVLIKLQFGVEAIAGTDCAASIVVLALSIYYSFVVLKERPKITHIEKRELVEMLSFSAAILLQAIVNQINGNVDTILLGAYISNKSIITMYSSALIIYSTYNQLVSIMGTFFLPKATRLVNNNASGAELTDFVIKPGRFQAMAAIAVVFGFAALGKQFISIWIGQRYIDAYYVILMLIVPVTVPLVENTAIAILDATLKRIFRSVVLVVMAVINVGISIVLIKICGFWGAAAGTFISLCIGHIILMNWYYAKTFNMNIKRMFLQIFKGILPSGFIAGVIVYFMSYFMPANNMTFIIRAGIFVVLYGGVLWLFGMTDEEKKYVKKII